MSVPAEAECFLSLIDDEAESWTFQTFDDAKKGRPLTRELHGSLDHYAVELLALNDAGAGIFVCPQVTDGRGRTKENIVSVRAVHLDDDDLGEVGELPLPPHIKVRTSEKGDNSCG